MKKEYSKISATAFMVANFRAKYTNMPYAKEIYQIAKKYSKRSLLESLTPFLGNLARFFPGSLERLSALEGRYLAINEVIKKQSNYAAIIEIASGLSARSLEWKDKNFLYLETDLPDLIKTKKNILKDYELNKNHYFLPLDAINHKQWDSLGKYIKNKKVAIIQEGLIAYLSRNEQEKLRNNIKNFLTKYSPNGVWITTDFSTMDQKENMLIGFSKKLINRNTKRKFNHFKSKNEAVDFLKAGGLKAKIIRNPIILKKLTCIKKSNMNVDKVKEYMKNYNVYYITLE